MKKTTYKDKSKDELVKSLYEKRSSLRAVRFGTAGSKTRNTKEAKNLKKEVARILTELNSPDRNKVDSK